MLLPAYKLNFIQFRKWLELLTLYGNYLMSKYSDLPDKNCIEYIVNNIVDVKKTKKLTNENETH